MRLYLVGDPDDVQHTIDYLSVAGCIDRIEWNRNNIEIPEGGFVVRPDTGDVLRYLQRYRQFG